MKNLKFKILLILILFNILYCKSKNELITETEIFNNYLNTVYEFTIPENLHYFILLPEIVCLGCTHQNMQLLNKYVTEENGKNFTLIYSANKNLIPPELHKKIKTYYDSHGNLDKLILNIANITLVKTNNHKIVFIKSVNANEEKTIIDFIPMLNENK